MKCYICDKTLGNDEIKHDPKYGHGNYDPCGSCMEIIGEVFEPLTEEDVDAQIAYEMYYADVTEDTSSGEGQISEDESETS